MTNGADEKLARVTYLPGVQPPSAPLAATADSVGEHVPLESIPGLVRASEIGIRSGAAKLDELPGKRFSGHTGEIQPLPAEHVAPRSARAHNVSLNALARRGVSSAEMADLLARRELDADEIEVEVARLEAVGLLDDGELARTLIRNLRERKGLGRSAINAELRRRKIESDAIDEAMQEAFPSDGVDELTRARELAIKRAPQLRSLDPETARRRLGAFLMRKGYSGSIVASAVAAALAPNHPALRQSGSRGPRFE
jgi:regulatory protein